LAAEKENFAQTPESYYTMYSSYISTKNSTDEATANSAIPPLTVPEGYYFVTHILVMNAEEGEEKDVEAIVAEIEAEIATLPETATAEEKIAKFNELIEKYNEDPGLDSEPYKTEGYLMHESLNNDSTTTYDPAFYEAALDLENMGDISAPVEGENGTHIIIRLNDVEVKDVDFASVKDAITENVKVEQENTVYEEQLAAWRETTKIVKNESRIAALNIVTTTSTGLDE
ncbi:MAG: peptidylprolyl isomerase, partial [Clostridia bacterium]|nr:peptidylprolyl isomerase [Clostridia bacterium]